MEKVLSACSPHSPEVTKVHWEPGTHLTYDTSFLLTSHNQRPWLSSHMSATMSQAYYGHHRPASAQDHHGWDEALPVSLLSSSAQHSKAGDRLAHRLAPRPHRARLSSQHCKRLVEAEISTQGFWRDRWDVLPLHHSPKTMTKMQCQVAPRSQTAFLRISLPEAALPYQRVMKLAHSKILASFREARSSSNPIPV